MGFSGIGPIKLLLVLAIVVMLFGTKKLRNLGGDLGGAFRGFRSAMREGEEEDAQARNEALTGLIGHQEVAADANKATQQAGENAGLVARHSLTECRRAPNCLHPSASIVRGMSGRGR